MAVWFEPLEPFCEEVWRVASSHFDADVVLFYLARRCQKSSGHVEPALDSFAEEELRDGALRIAQNLAQDGERVDRLVDGAADEWTALRGMLRASAGPRAGQSAADYADEALQKIAVVLLTGTPPARAIERLREGPDGPRNEYIFTSPLSNWARAVVINHVLDELRRAKRDLRRKEQAPRQPASELDVKLLERAKEALPSLVDAIRGLPTTQRSVMVASLSRSDIDDVVVECLHDLAPDLFSQAFVRCASDGEIAEHMASTPRLVAANRSAARRKLARNDPLWALLLDVLMPHRSTRPAAIPEPEGKTHG